MTVGRFIGRTRYDSIAKRRRCNGPLDFKGAPLRACPAREGGVKAPIYTSSI